MLFICYQNCSNCKAIEKSLVEKNISFEKRDIKEENPTRDEIKAWHLKSGLGLKKFFNTSGNVYRELQLKDKLPTMDLEAQYDLLGTNGMLVKRPILISDEQILVGPMVKEWISQL